MKKTAMLAVLSLCIGFTSMVNIADAASHFKPQTKPSVRQEYRGPVKPEKRPEVHRPKHEVRSSHHEHHHRYRNERFDHRYGPTYRKHYRPLPSRRYGIYVIDQFFWYDFHGRRHLDQIWGDRYGNRYYEIVY